jgi:hypothetical protein
VMAAIAATVGKMGLGILRPPVGAVRSPQTLQIPNQAGVQLGSRSQTPC